MGDIHDSKPPHRGLKKGLFVIPTLFTAANIGMGFLAVMMSIRGYHASFTSPVLAAEFFNIAALAIGLAILFDTIDGRVARATRTATEIGVQLDSLADVVTFGIAPTALVYAWSFGAIYNEGTFPHNLGIFLLFAYLMCGAFRLARFNLQASRPQKLEEGATKVDKKSFVGLPIPPAGGLLASLIHFAPMPLNSYGESTAQFYGYALMGLIAVLGILMVSKIRYSSMKTAGAGPQGILLVVLIAGLAMFVYFYSRYALLGISGAYVLHGLVWWVIRAFTVKRSGAVQKSA
jgi:CDP-diacylglycerol--serine O-phosphatidyltransferase